MRPPRTPPPAAILFPRPAARREIAPGFALWRWACALAACVGFANSECRSAPEIASTPIPRPGAEKIRGRAEKEFVLKVVGNQMGVDFELDTRTTRGKIQSLNANSSQLKYTPPADRGIARDSFLFRARRGQAYSPWETFQIALLDSGPRLQAPSALDFGTLRLGETKTLQLLVLNSGDATAIEELSIQKPWSVEPSQSPIQIPPEKELILQVSIRAEAVGRAVSELSIGRGVSYLPIKLQVEVPRWVEITPASLTLNPTDPAEPASVRAAEFSLKNPNPVPETYHLESQGDLQHPAEVALQPGETRAVRVRFASTNPGSGRGKLRVRAASVGTPPEIERTQIIPWEAAPLPPALSKQLKTSTDPNLLHSTLSLSNLGGKAGTWTLSCTGPFLFGTTGSLQVALAPKQTTEIRVQEIPPKKGLSTPPVTSGHIQFSGPDGTSTLALQSRLITAPPAPPPPLNSSPAPQTTPTSPPPPAQTTPPQTADVVRFSSRQGTATRPPAKAPSPAKDIVRLAESPDLAPVPTRSENDQEMVRELLSNIYIPFISGIVLKDVTPRTATLLLPFPPTPERNLPLLFEGRFKPETEGNPELVWKPMRYDKPTRDALDRLEYHIRGLEPGSTVTLRILGPLLQNGKRQPLHQQEFRTPPEPPNPYLRPALLGAILLGTIALWIRARRE